MVNNYLKEGAANPVSGKHWDLKNKDKPYDKVVKGPVSNSKIVQTID